MLGRGMCCPTLLEEGTRGAPSPPGRSALRGRAHGLSHPAFPGGFPPRGGGQTKKKASKTPPSIRKKKKRGEKEGERRWGVCGHVRRREKAGGPGVSKEPSRGQAAPGAAGRTKALPTEHYQARKFLIFFTELLQES